MKVPYLIAIKLAFVLLFFSFTSCEYEIDGENFNDSVKAPDKNTPTATINLLDYNEGDTIFLAYNATIYYAKQETALSQVVNYQFDFPTGLSWYYNDVVILRSSDLNNGYYTLSATIQTIYNDASIAGQINGIRITETKKWVVKVEKQYPAVSLQQKLNADGLVEYSWEITGVDKKYIDGINVYKYGSGYLNRDLTVDQTSFVDSSYCGGAASLYLTVYFNNLGIYALDKYLEYEYPLPKLISEVTDHNTIKLTWDSPIKAFYQVATSVNWGYETVHLDNSTEKTVEIPIPPFGSLNNYSRIYLKARGLVSDDWQTADDVPYGLEHLIIGYYRALDLYNPINNLLYLYKDNYEHIIGAFNVVDASETVHKEMSLSLWATSYKTAKIAAINASSITVYDGNNLSSLLEIPLRANTYQKGLSFTNDNRLSLLENVFLPNNSTQDVFTIYNAATGQKELTFTLPEGKIAYGVLCSPSGNFVCFLCDNLYHMYKIGATELSFIRTIDYADYEHFSFHPILDDVIVTEKNNKVNFMSADNLQIIKTIDIGTSIFCNIDPKTGNLLTRGVASVFVKNPDTGEDLYTIPSIAPNPKLLGNTLFDNTDYALLYPISR